MKTAIVLAVLLAASVCFGEATIDREGTPWQTGPADPDFSHPGDLLYEHECYVYAEEFDPVAYQYHYYQDFEGHLFDQIPGNIYWVTITAVVAFPPQWGWCESDQIWMDEGVFRSDFFGFPEWTPMSDVLGYPVEFAFVLWGADGLIKWAQYPLPGGACISSQLDPAYGMDSEAGDDFLCTDPVPIAAIEWWGDYFNGAPTPPDHFIIRFYGDVPATPVEDMSWGSIKAMFQ